MKINKIILSYSVLNAYKQCPTYFKERYFKNLSKPEIPNILKGSPLIFGQLAHKFLELYHGGVEGGQALSKVLEEAASTSLSVVRPSELRSIYHLELLLSKYLRNYPNPNSDFVPILLNGKPALEPENDFHLATYEGCNIIWRQHYDGVVKMTGGYEEHAILEHKTSSGNLHEDLVERMLPNDQVVSYVYGARKTLDIPVKGVLFNGLCTYRPLVNDGYRPRPGSMMLPLFYRRMVEVEDWQLAEWETETLRTIKRLMEDIQDNVFGKNAPDACTIWNKRCMFADLCKTTGQNKANIQELAYEQGLRWKGFEIEFDK